MSATSEHGKNGASGGVGVKEPAPFTDSPEQARVVNAPVDDDVLVVAGAGSGKTYTMTRRIIELIERGVSPERILGLTFTRKAASELLARVSAAVSTHDGGAGGAFMKPEVATYDAFFQTIVRQYGLLVGFDQNTQPLSEAGALQLATVAVERHMDLLLADDYGGFQTVVSKVLALSHAIGNAMIGGETATVGEAIVRIRAWDAALAAQLDDAIGDEPVPDEEPKTTAPRMVKDPAVNEERRAEYRERMHRYCVYRCDRLRNVVKHRETLLTLVEEYENEKRRRNMAEFSDFTIAAYQLVTRFPSIGERYRRRYTHVLLDEYQDTSTTQSMVIAALFHPHDGDAGGSARAESHNGTRDTRGARKGAGNGHGHGTGTGHGTGESDGRSSARVNELRDRLASIGIAPKSGADGENDGGRRWSIGVPAADAHTRSAVNAVGDPFQSIYAWRGASPGAFRMFQNDFDMPENSRPYPLSVTRRNARIVLDAANNLTAPLRVPPRRRGSSLMREVDVAKLTTMDTAPEGTIGVLGFDTFGQEIDAVARFARRAIERYTPTDDGVKDNRPHVAVLFRSKTHMAEFAQGLERSGLTTLVVGYSALLERPEVRDLLALLHAVADHTDSNALMRLLATPRFGLHADELAALARLAERLDAEYRYRALVEAGLVKEDDGRSPAQAVKDYRDQVPHAVFLADLLTRKDLASLLGRHASADGRGDRDGGIVAAGGNDAAFGATTVETIIRAGDMLRQVQNVANHPLPEVIETAITALNLDIDTIVAQRVMRPDQPVNPAQARAGLDAIVSLTDTYTREIAADADPTLRGFMAWVDSLESIEEETAAMPDTPVDVVLMTIHQSKGLEWDAVAIAGMSAGSFPSSQGGLRIAPDDDHPGGVNTDGVWVPPEYRPSVATWLDDPAAVPVPVRVDAGILPRFPHDAAPGTDPFDALRMLDDVEVIDDEIYGDLRGRDIGDDADAVDPDGWYLTQGEEYGRRLLADERRLAYVALTRARYDALLTYSRHSDVSRDSRPYADGKNASQPSVFWNEVCDSLCHRPDVLSAAGTSAGDALDASDARSGTVEPGQALAGETLDGVGVARPNGFFAGEHAADYLRAVVEDAWRTPLEQRREAETLSWPAGLSDDVLARVSGGLTADDRHIGGRLPSGDGFPPSGGSAGKRTSVPAKDSLTARAGMLVADRDLMPWFVDDDRELDDHVRRQAERMLAGKRQNVTSLQARAGHLNQRDARALWRGLVRPIPHVVSPAAQAGTVFHAWAERFIGAFDDGDLTEDGGIMSAESDDSFASFPTGTGLRSRESMIAELAEREAGLKGGLADDVADDGGADAAKDAELAVWQRRLVESWWARRRPAWVERQIVVALPQLGDTIINGKLDAVFHGGLDADDPTKRFTVIDWKTGHRPRTEREIREKLVQLDWYRLLLSTMENTPLDSIDAALYYVSESDEGLRELRAHAKTEQDILAELNSGIPEQSDDD